MIEDHKNAHIPVAPTSPTILPNMPIDGHIEGNNAYFVY